MAETGENNTISVAVRIRPPNQQELSSTQAQIVRALDEHVVVFDPVDEFGREKDTYRPGVPGYRKAKDLRYAFDRVFGQAASQNDVYSGTTKPLLKSLFDGYNCSVFAYGATGAGKTHTMLGYSNDPGVMVLTMQELFELVEVNRSERTIQVTVSMMEVYNEMLRDLLIPYGHRSVSLDVREDADGSIAVPGLSEHEPKNAIEVLELLARGNNNRTVSPTNVNATSSRSHAVLQIRIRQKDRASGTATTVRVSKLSMIDLAGSERASATKNEGDRLTEGANINKSLLALGNCINALGDPTRKGAHVPYRNSKLTRLLKDSLGGNCRTVMIANVSPSAMNYEDTHNTLKYANRAKEIKMKLDQNIVSVEYHVNAYTTIIHELKQQLAQLKEKSQVVSFGTSDSYLIAQQQVQQLASMYEDLVVQHTALWSEIHRTLWQQEIATIKAQTSDNSNNIEVPTSALQQLNALEQQQAQIEQEMEQWLNNQVGTLSAPEVEFCRLQLLSKVHFNRRQELEKQLAAALGHADAVTALATGRSCHIKQPSNPERQQQQVVVKEDVSTNSPESSTKALSLRRNASARQSPYTRPPKPASTSTARRRSMLPVLVHSTDSKPTTQTPIRIPLSNVENLQRDDKIKLSMAKDIRVTRRTSLLPQPVRH